MMRIILNGAGGRMGAVVRDLVAERGAELDAEISGRADPASQGGFAPIQNSIVSGDLVMDFSHHSAVKDLLPWAAGRKLPVIIATTGHTPEELALIQQYAKEIPIFFAANLSMGVALMADFAKRAAAAFPGADIEIVETHHNRKLDAPSGTALTLARAVQAGRPESTVAVGRSGMGKRKPGEITIHALRMGNIAGQHEIHITTDHEQLTLRHEAYDRVLFAEGAMVAARFLLNKPAGLYGMEDILNG
jgi:4-hydroxy-tetrahydrodipicolinate reductase